MGLVLVGLFFAELLVSLKVGLVIGFGWSVVWIVTTALFGALLMRLSPYALMHAFNTMNLSALNVRNAHNAALAYLFSAVLLIVPGVLTDAIGALLLLYSLYLRLFVTMASNDPNYDYHKGDDDVIDVEIIHDHDRGESGAER
jgi:UPF0716 family protein affecting phage T7 exclusion